MTTWLQHVKQVHAAGNTSFKESLKRASASWKKSKGKPAAAAAPKKKKRGKKKPVDEEEKSFTDEQEDAPKKKRKKRVKKGMPTIPSKRL